MTVEWGELVIIFLLGVLVGLFGFTVIHSQYELERAILRGEASYTPMGDIVWRQCR